MARPSIPSLQERLAEVRRESVECLARGDHVGFSHAATHEAELFSRLLESIGQARKSKKATKKR